MPVIIPNPFWPQVASRGQNPESLLSGGHPGTKSFQMTPQSPFYMAWRPRFTPANAEFNRDFSKNSLPGEVLALALHLGVFGAGLDPDGPGCPGTP